MLPIGRGDKLGIAALAIAPGPKLQTVAITVGAVVLSWAVVHVFTQVVGIEPTRLTDILSAGMPAVLSPLLTYPLLRANTRLKRTQAELERVAYTDMLTGLPNRRAFFDRASVILSRAGQDERPVSAMMVDIDHFKPINDTYGHDAGDDVLAAVASMVRRAVAASGADDWIVARMGGEEFAVIVDGLPVPVATRLAETICVAARSIDRVRQKVGRLAVTLSVGVAFGTQKMGIDELLRAADGAVYDAKRCGRDRWSVALGDFGDDLPAGTVSFALSRQRRQDQRIAS